MIQTNLSILPFFYHFIISFSFPIIYTFLSFSITFTIKKMKLTRRTANITYLLVMQMVIVSLSLLFPLIQPLFVVNYLKNVPQLPSSVALSQPSTMFSLQSLSQFLIISSSSLHIHILVILSLLFYVSGLLVVCMMVLILNFVYKLNVWLNL